MQDIDVLSTCTQQALPLLRSAARVQIVDSGVPYCHGLPYYA